MFDMFLNSIVLFFKGKLFQDMGSVVKQALIGITITAVICIVAAKIGAPLWLAFTLGAIVGGLIQPWLFKDLKYA
jgi:hypothetical protein